MAWPDKEAGKKYFAKWYAKNKVKLSKARKARYKKDPEYRTAVLKSNVEHRKATAGPPAGGAWTGKAAKPTTQTGRRLTPRLTTLVSGETVPCHSLGSLLDAVGVSKTTVVAWEGKGVIPAATYRDGQGRRWYADCYIKALAGCVARGREQKWTTDQLEEAVKKVFEEEKCVGTEASPSK